MEPSPSQFAIGGGTGAAATEAGGGANYLRIPSFSQFALGGGTGAAATEAGGGKLSAHSSFSTTPLGHWAIGPLAGDLRQRHARGLPRAAVHWRAASDAARLAQRAAVHRAAHILPLLLRRLALAVRPRMLRKRKCPPRLSSVQFSARLGRSRARLATPPRPPQRMAPASRLLSLSPRAAGPAEPPRTQLARCS